MAKPRIFIEEGSEAGVYHVFSRAVDGKDIFSDAEKEAFIRMMRAFARFHQIEVITFCVMRNHFHIVVKVPTRPAGFDLPLATVMERWQATVDEASSRTLQRQFARYLQNGCEALIEAWRRRMLDRMFRLTDFMKSLKQCFTQWFNRRHGRRGTLWEGRYKHVIVEDAEAAMNTICTYVDLNPVRAGIVTDPGEYRWCGYAEAMAGKPLALEGLMTLTGLGSGPRGHAESGDPGSGDTPRERRRRELLALAEYRRLLGIAGRPRVTEDGRVIRRGLSPEVQERMAAKCGVRTELLRRKVRHLTDGVILGSRDFIDRWFERHRYWFGGRSREHRATGARRIGPGWKSLWTLRDLRS
jgi:REP element-mobilizing transposase RayT